MRSLLLTLLLAPVARAADADQILWGPFSNEYALDVFKDEIQKRLPDGTAPKAETVAFKIPQSTAPSSRNGEEAAGNPFNIGDNFLSGDYFVPAGRTPGPVPETSPRDAAWFQELADKKICPRFFIIAGHQVISHGWHDHEETRFLFLPTLRETAKKYPAARQILSCVKVAVLFGCNTMTNLEPHRADGAGYSPEEIRALYESGAEGKKRVLGSAVSANTLDFYRERLAREYGPTNPHGLFEYYRDKSLEKCVLTRKRNGQDWPVENLDCVMPDRGLFDGTRRYNYPFIARELFPNAALVLGFSSASPDNKPASLILQATFDQSRKEINGGLPQTSPAYLENILHPLTDDDAPLELKKRIVAAIRRNWSLVTFRRNRGRPSGSITPRFPEFDRDGIIPTNAMKTIIVEAKRRGISLNAPAYGP